MLDGMCGFDETDVCTQALAVSGDPRSPTRLITNYGWSIRTVSAADSTEIERWLSSLEYGDVNKLDRMVEFGYENRPDPEYGFAYGVRRERLRRLFAITMSIDAGGWKPTRTYNLKYQNQGSSKVSKLERLFECGPVATDCLRPTTFKWSDSKVGFGDGSKQSSPTQSLVPTSGASQLLTADLTGDGRTDLAGGRRMAVYAV